MTTSSDDLQALYRDLILDHAQKPRNFGKLNDATHSAEGINPLCGDKLHLYLRIDGDDRVRAARFEASGCAISIASASLLTETIENQSIDAVDACIDTVTARLMGQEPRSATPPLALDKLHALDGVRQYPSRVKCATLPWRALSAALKQQSSPASTE